MDEKLIRKLMKKSESELTLKRNKYFITIGIRESVVSANLTEVVNS